MLPLLSEEEIDAMDSVDEKDDDPMSMEMLEDIRDGSHSHPNVNNREARYKINDHIKQIQSEWIGALKATQNMGKVLHGVFKTVVKDISKDLSLGESGSEISHFISEPRKFVEVAKLSYYIKKPWIKANQK